MWPTLWDAGCLSQMIPLGPQGLFLDVSLSPVASSMNHTKQYKLIATRYHLNAQLHNSLNFFPVDVLLIKPPSANITFKKWPQLLAILSVHMVRTERQVHKCKIY